MTSTLTITVPLRTKSETNLREHWATKARRVKKERDAVHYAWRAAWQAVMCRGKWPLPVRVTLTRIAPRGLDDDNLRSALKHARDQVAAHLGVDDGSPLVTWEYAERKPDKPRTYAVEIRVETR